MKTTVAGLDVQVQGSGEPVLLVHGSGGGPDSWTLVAAELAESFEVWTFVRRGYGPGPAPATFAEEVPDLQALLDAIERPARVVGASLGATLVLHAALSDPRGMRSLALFEPPLLLPGQHLHGVRARYEVLTAAGDHAKAGLLLAREVIHLPEELVALLANAPGPDPVDAHREARGWIGDLRQLAADTTDTARWSAITLPTLLMQGADTWPPIPEGVEALARALPHVERLAWEGQSHFVTMTAPHLFAAAVAEFAHRQV